MELMDSIVFPKENVFEKSLAQIGNWPWYALYFITNLEYKFKYQLE